MSKGLEALEIIKGALVEIEYDEEEGVILSAWQEHEEETKIIEKELKALEIMTKSLEIGEEDFFYDDKENIYYFIGSEISKEKYDLLKEVLL